MKHVCVILLVLTSHLVGHERPSSEPYITGDCFRVHCQFVLDEDSDFNPRDVKCGDAIFVRFDYLDRFFSRYAPQITTKYILVSANHDVSAPARYLKFFDEDKLYAWFTQNLDSAGQEKVIAIPIGIWPKHWVRHRSDDEIIRKIQRTLPVNKNILFYCNFGVNTNPGYRADVYNIFKAKACASFYDRCKYEPFLHQLARSKFVLSPHGAGLDCFRTWEALYMGSYPVVKASTLDVLYKDLPVVIVNEWEEITQEFLEKKYLEMNAKTWRLEKLYFPYWLDLLRKKQDECRRGTAC